MYLCMRVCVPLPQTHACKQYCRFTSYTCIRTHVHMYRLTSNMYTYICKRTHIPDADLVKFWLFAPAKRWTLEFDIKHPPKDEESKDFKIEISLSGACSGLVPVNWTSWTKALRSRRPPSQPSRLDKRYPPLPVCSPAVLCFLELRLIYLDP